MNTINPLQNQGYVPSGTPVKAKETSSVSAAPSESFASSSGVNEGSTPNEASMKSVCSTSKNLKLRSQFMKATHSVLAALMLATAAFPGPAFAAEGLAASQLKDPTVGDGKPAVELSISGNEKDFFHDAKDVFERIDHANFSKQIGDYKMNVDYINARVRVRPKLNPKYDDGKFDASWKLEARPKLELLNTELVKTQQDGKWFEAQGLRGRTTGEWALGYEGSSTKEAKGIDNLEVRTTVEGFKSWYRDIGENMHLNIDAVAGGSHEFMNGQSELHVNFRQRLTGENLEIMNQKFGWFAEARENFNYDIGQRDFNPGYEVSGGLSKNIPVKAFGKQAVLKAELGARIKGDRHDSFDIGPVTKLKVDF
ncbi:MAG: hypothetical protein LWY06_07970 [Firmicutes bacterium]|nr:hypothetical protein [Bacillota bacterium]